MFVELPATTKPPGLRLTIGDWAEMIDKREADSLGTD
jgi:hypothetical protein